MLVVIFQQSFPAHTHCYTHPHLGAAHYNHQSSTISCWAVPLEQFSVSSQLKDNSAAVAEGAVSPIHLFSQPKLATFLSPAHSLTSRFPRSDLIFFANTSLYTPTVAALCRRSAATAYCDRWAAPPKHLRVNCHFQGHLDRSCSFRLQLCQTVSLT